MEAAHGEFDAQNLGTLLLTNETDGFDSSGGVGSRQRNRPGFTLTDVFENGGRPISLDIVVDLGQYCHLILPHYMGREAGLADRDRYQTVFAREEGAIAPPAAGLHFTPTLLEKLPHTFTKLHLGVGTFRTVSAEGVANHIMHSGRSAASPEKAEKVNAAGRVVTIRTTVARVLESIGRPLREKRGETDIFTHPPYHFSVVADC